MTNTDSPYVAYLAENRAEKMAFFEAVAKDLGQGVRVRTWPMSWRGYPQTDARACLFGAGETAAQDSGRALVEAGVSQGPL
ncbi:MAG: hypothetical protein P8P56_14890 [Yoonia sp.]|nr:hypothetical protein [Yoonia sp.]